MKRTLTLAQYEEAIDANFVLVLIGKRDIPKKINQVIHKIWILKNQ